jgi:hypothetical protein
MPVATQMRPSRPAARAARRPEAGWVLAATLILSALAISVTVTYARHAILAKKSLEFGKGASPVEEASRSEMDRVRELMRNGDPPGTIDEGTHDESITPTGEVATGERKVDDNDAQKRDLKVHAKGVNPNSDDEYKTKAKAKVEPASGPTKNKTTIKCETGDILLSGSLMIISGPTEFQGVELAGLVLLEEGATLKLTDCVLRGTILTRHGACKDYPAATGLNRPAVNVFGGLRLLAGNELPDTAMCAPDALFTCDDAAQVEVKGFACADEITVKGKGSVKGMLVYSGGEEVDSTYTRPGHGRGTQAYPDHVEPGGEEIMRVSFPNTPIPDATLDLMCSAPIGS